MDLTTSLWSLSLCNFRGIKVKLHISLPLALCGALIGSEASGSLNQKVAVFLLFLFSLILRELLFLWVGRRLGHLPAEIMLYPFGASPLYRSQPKESVEIKGAIGAGLGSLLLAYFFWQAGLAPAPWFNLPTPALQQLAGFNLLLAFVGLLPLPPFTGGRLWRALGSHIGFRDPESTIMRLGLATATVLCLLAVVYGDLLVAVLGGLLLTLTLGEFFYGRARPLVAGLTAADVMVPADELIKLNHGTCADRGIDQVMRSFQGVFPVVHGTDLIGLIARPALVRAAAIADEPVYLAELMTREIETVSAAAPLSDVLELIDHGGHQIVAVAAPEDGSFAGLIFKDQVFELLFVRGARQVELDQPNDGNA